MRNMDLRKKLRGTKDEIKTLKLISGKVSKDENDSSHLSMDSDSDKLDNPNLGGKEAKLIVTGKMPQKSKSLTNSGTVPGASPKRNAAVSDGTLKVGSSHSHNNISQLSTTSTPKAKGSNQSLSTSPPKVDLNQKDQPEPKNGSDVAGRIIRPRSAVKDTEARSRASALEVSAGSRSIREKSEGSHRRIESMSTIGTPPLVPPLRSHTNGTKASGHKHTQSLHDFDPLKSTVPLISYPTPLSFETLSIKNSATPESVSLPQCMGQSSVVMPVSFGMAPTTVRTTDGGFRRSPSPMTGRGTLIANDYQGLHEQQYMVVPQQQQIVFNQMTYPTQQRTNTFQNHQYTGRAPQQQNTQHQPIRSHIQQQTHHHQTQQSNQQTYTTASANPFDPFSS